MKRGILLLGFICLIIILTSGLISAESLLPMKSPDNVVSVTERSYYTQNYYGTSAIFKPITDMFNGWFAGELDLTFAKWIFSLILFIVIFVVSDSIPFFHGERKTGARVIFSILVAFLATAYLSLEELYVLLVSYSAMGIAIGIIVPFIILLFFSIKLGSYGGVGGLIIQRIMWLIFGVWLVYRLFFGSISTADGVAQLGTGGTIVILIVLILTALFVFANKTIMKYLFKLELNTEEEAAIRAVERRAAARRVEDAEARTRLEERGR